MNVILLFAVIALTFSVIKDFWDSEWKCVPKNLLNMCLLGFAFFPFLCNLYVFFTSNVPKWKIFAYHVIKFSTMDFFEDYLFERCAEDNIKIFGFKFSKWLFCNKATGYLTLFYSGKIFMLKRGFKMSIHYDEIYNHLSKGKTKMSIYQLRKVVDTYKGRNTEFGNKLTEFFFKNENLKPSWFLLVNEGIISIPSNDKLDFRIDDKSCFTKSYLTANAWKNDTSVLDKEQQRVYNIGKLTVNVSSLGKLFLVGRKKSYEFDFGEGAENWFVMNIVLEFWQSNVDRGILKDQGHERGDVVVVHCLSIKELCDGVREGYYIDIKDAKVSKYSVEGIDLKTPSLIKAKETISKLIGRVNSQLFENLIVRNLGEFNLEIAFNLLAMPSAMKVLDYKDLYTNLKMRRLFFECDYFFRLIDIGYINGIDKKLKIRRETVEDLRKHQKCINFPKRKLGNNLKNINLDDVDPEMRSKLTSKTLIQSNKQFGKMLNTNKHDIDINKKLKLPKPMKLFQEDIRKEKEIIRDHISLTYAEVLKSGNDNDVHLKLFKMFKDESEKAEIENLKQIMKKIDKSRVGSSNQKNPVKAFINLSLKKFTSLNDNIRGELAKEAWEIKKKKNKNKQFPANDFTIKKQKFYDSLIEDEGKVYWYKGYKMLLNLDLKGLSEEFNTDIGCDKLEKFRGKVLQSKRSVDKKKKEEERLRREKLAREKRVLDEREKILEKARLEKARKKAIEEEKAKRIQAMAIDDNPLAGLNERAVKYIQMLGLEKTYEKWRKTDPAGHDTVCEFFERVKNENQDNKSMRAVSANLKLRAFENLCMFEKIISKAKKF